MRSATAANMSATGQTGGICREAGPYRPSRNPTIVVFFKQGDKFPVDPVDGRATVWTMSS